jgi:[NiFe] hydrogenase diaphorase moiety small subunit
VILQEHTITIDGVKVPFKVGQTIMDAAMAAGIYIPHLCHSAEFTPHGSCKLCTVTVNGRDISACNTRAVPGQEVLNNTKALQDLRRSLTQMLFIEGNHTCPACEKSGNCQLQAVAYYVNMLSYHYPHFYPYREVDASHAEIWLDFNRCILCELCVRASRDVDKKNVFALSGRGTNTRLIVNSPTGKLVDTDFSINDKAASVCPVGVIMRKQSGYLLPIGQRFYDNAPINIAGDVTNPPVGAKVHG